MYSISLDESNEMLNSNKSNIRWWFSSCNSFHWIFTGRINLPSKDISHSRRESFSSFRFQSKLLLSSVCCFYSLNKIRMKSYTHTKSKTNKWNITESNAKTLWMFIHRFYSRRTCAINFSWESIFCVHKNDRISSIRLFSRASITFECNRRVRRTRKSIAKSELFGMLLLLEVCSSLCVCVCVL